MKMFSKKAITTMQTLIVAVILIIALVAGVVAYYLWQAPAPTVAGDVVYIGNIQCMSGSGTRMGIPATRGLQLAFDEINRLGGITVAGKQYNLSMITEDSASTTEGAVAAAHKLIDENNVKIIHGEDGSARTLAIIPITKAAKVIQITEVSSSVAIIDAGDPYMFRSTYSARMSARADILTMKALNFTKVGYIGDDSAASISQRDSMIAAGNEVGINVTAVIFPTGTTDWYPYLTVIKGYNLQAIRPYMWNTGDALACTSAWVELNMTSYLFGAIKEPAMNIETNETRTAYINAAKLTKVFGTDGEWNFSDPVSLSAIAHVTQLSQAKYGEGPSETHFRAWDTGLILAQALEAAGSVNDTDKIAYALANTVFRSWHGLDMVRFMPQTFSKVHFGQLVEPLFSFNLVVNATTNDLQWTFGGIATYQDY